MMILILKIFNYKIEQRVKRTDFLFKILPSYIAIILFLIGCYRVSFVQNQTLLFFYSSFNTNLLTRPVIVMDFTLGN